MRGHLPPELLVDDGVFCQHNRYKLLLCWELWRLGSVKEWEE
jgi:hypothetical protein